MNEDFTIKIIIFLINKLKIVIFMLFDIIKLSNQLHAKENYLNYI